MNNQPQPNSFFIIETQVVRILMPLFGRCDDRTQYPLPRSSTYVALDTGMRITTSQLA
jgi:hypothetical protein